MILPSKTHIPDLTSQRAGENARVVIDIRVSFNVNTDDCLFIHSMKHLSIVWYCRIVLKPGDAAKCKKHPPGFRPYILRVAEDSMAGMGGINK